MPPLLPPYLFDTRLGQKVHHQLLDYPTSALTHSGGGPKARASERALATTDARSVNRPYPKYRRLRMGAVDVLNCISDLASRRCGLLSFIMARWSKWGDSPLVS
jgi:hypothetical protein